MIWQHPVSRLAALLSAAALVALTVSAVLRRSFAPRAVVEIRQSGGPEGATDIRVTDSGRPAAAEILLTTDSDVSRPLAPDGTGPPYSALRTATFRVRDATARQLKVWVHEVTPENNSESLPAEIEFEWGGTTRRYELRAGARPIDLKLDAGEFTLTVRPRQPGRAPAARATRLP